MDTQETVPDFSFEQIIEIISTIGDWIFTAALIIAPVMVIISAFMFLTSGHDPQGFNNARKFLLMTAVGFGVVLLGRGLFAALRSLLETTP
jgi:hypothetical protein